MTTSSKDLQLETYGYYHGNDTLAKCRRASVGTTGGPKLKYDDGKNDGAWPHQRRPIVLDRYRPSAYLGIALIQRRTTRPRNDS